MRFFIPGANDVAHGEQMYRHAREQIERSFGPVSDRRICRLKFRDNGQVMNVAVGDGFGDDGKPVFAIYETGQQFVILTSVYGPPSVEARFTVPTEDVLDVEHFTAVA